MREVAWPVLPLAASRPARNSRSFPDMLWRSCMWELKCSSGIHHKWVGVFMTPLTKDRVKNVKKKLKECQHLRMKKCCHTHRKYRWRCKESCCWWGPTPVLMCCKQKHASRMFTSRPAPLSNIPRGSFWKKAKMTALQNHIYSWDSSDRPP